MTEEDFRFKHSELIEYYQYIEMRLKAICAGILANEEKSWIERLDDYESDSFGTLLTKIKEIQKQKQITVLNKDDLAKLDKLRITRNYWAHQCFGGKHPIIFKKETVNRNEYANKIITDLNEAVEWDEKLTNKILKK